MTRENNLAWQAGVFDGEGSININRKSGALQVSIGNNSPIIIDAFAVYRDYHVHRQSANALQLTWSGERARTLLEALLPYLELKKKQATLALKFLDRTQDLLDKRVVTGKQGRAKRSHEEWKLIDTYFTEIRSLNRERPYHISWWGLPAEEIYKQLLEERV